MVRLFAEETIVTFPLRAPVVPDAVNSNECVHAEPAVTVEGHALPACVQPVGGVMTIEVASRSPAFRSVIDRRTPAARTVPKSRDFH